jgi:hypothetical protein
MRKNLTLLIFSGLSIAACTPATQLTQDAKDAAYESADRAKDFGKWLITPPEKPQPNAIAASYCYNVMQDILCYRQPLPGGEFRLAGYQGTGAEAPPPAIMRPLPLRDTDMSKVPVNRVAGAQPVFVNIPDAVKEDKDKASITPQEISREPLPDPALAPQL